MESQVKKINKGGRPRKGTSKIESGGNRHMVCLKSDTLIELQALQEELRLDFGFSPTINQAIQYAVRLHKRM